MNCYVRETPKGHWTARRTTAFVLSLVGLWIGIGGFITKTFVFEDDSVLINVLIAVVSVVVLVIDLLALAGKPLRLRPIPLRLVGIAILGLLLTFCAAIMIGLFIDTLLSDRETQILVMAVFLMVVQSLGAVGVFRHFAEEWRMWKKDRPNDEEVKEIVDRTRKWYYVTDCNFPGLPYIDDVGKAAIFSDAETAQRCMQRFSYHGRLKWYGFFALEGKSLESFFKNCFSKGITSVTVITPYFYKELPLVTVLGEEWSDPVNEINAGYYLQAFKTRQRLARVGYCEALKGLSRAAKKEKEIARKEQRVADERFLTSPFYVRLMTANSDQSHTLLYSPHAEDLCERGGVTGTVNELEKHVFMPDQSDGVRFYREIGKTSMTFFATYREAVSSTGMSSQYIIGVVSGRDIADFYRSQGAGGISFTDGYTISMG